MMAANREPDPLHKRKRDLNAQLGSTGVSKDDGWISRKKPRLEVTNTSTATTFYKQTTLDTAFAISSPTRPSYHRSMMCVAAATEVTLESPAAPALQPPPKLAPIVPPTKRETTDHDAPPEPQYVDAWDDDHVKLPCSPRNRAMDGSPKWELIKQVLSTRRFNSSKDIEDTILTLNPRYKGRWDFSGLHAFFADKCTSEYHEHFFGNTLPAMAQLALLLPRLCRQPLPLLRQHIDRSILLSQKQIACLLANAFFCTFPLRNPLRGKAPGAEYTDFPSINFSELFMASGVPGSAVQGTPGCSPSHAAKFRCLFHYFARVTSAVPRGNVSFHRRVLGESDVPAWADPAAAVCSVPLGPIEARPAGTIEDGSAPGDLCVDFANRLIGGGVLGRGAAQEELRFVISPELIVSRLFTQGLMDNECLVVVGAERYSLHSGYGSGFRFEGDFQDTTPRDGRRRRRTVVVAIDALVLPAQTGQSDECEQYAPAMLERELNKAYCGFSWVDHDDTDRAAATTTAEPAVATGNWGCGVFQGDPQLKSVLQWMAASAARRNVKYFTFGDSAFAAALNALAEQLRARATTVSMGLLLLSEWYIQAHTNAHAGDMWQALCEYYHLVSTSTSPSSLGLFDYLTARFAAIESVS